MSERSETQAPGWFATTHWSVVLQAKDSSAPGAADAVSALCQSYWRPIHTYIRQRGFSSHDAEDLTQQFFAQFIRKEQYRLAQRDRGRFRSFLLIVFKRFLVNEWERASAQKRGGGQRLLSLDEDGSDKCLSPMTPADERSADRIYDETWAVALLEKVRTSLQSEFEQEGKREKFLVLEKFLPGEESELTYAEAAARIGVAEGTLKSDVHRLKRRFRELLRQEVAHTVATPAEIDGELRYLITLLA